jgi:hypothetical protein
VNKIQRTSLILKNVFLIIMILIPVVTLYFWVSLNPTMVAWGVGSSQGLTPILQHGIPMPYRMAALCVSLLPMITNVLEFYFLYRLFSLYQQGIFFTERAACLIRNVGIVMLVWQVIHPIYDLLLTFVVSMSQKHHHFMGVSFSNHDAADIVFALVIIVVAWVMREAAKLQQDQQLTV